MITFSTEQIIKLINIPGIGRQKVLKLMNYATSEIQNDSELFSLIQSNIENLHLSNCTNKDIEKAFLNAENIIKLSNKMGIRIISFQDKNYPQILKNFPDFPLLLNYLGDIKILSKYQGIAIIGTRNPTKTGLAISKEWGELVAKAKFNVISGLAIGCDTEAHKGALAVNGITTAVMAHGLDYIYPKENEDLRNNIINSGGLVISEYFVGTKPTNYSFVLRDKIQVALSSALVVIEANLNSGTMYTVNYAIKHNHNLAIFSENDDFLQHIRQNNTQTLFSSNNIQLLSTAAELMKFLRKIENKK